LPWEVLILFGGGRPVEQTSVARLSGRQQEQDQCGGDRDAGVGEHDIRQSVLRQRAQHLFNHVAFQQLFALLFQQC